MKKSRDKYYRICTTIVFKGGAQATYCDSNLYDQFEVQGEVLKKVSTLLDAMKKGDTVMLECDVGIRGDDVSSFIVEKDLETL